MRNSGDFKQVSRQYPDNANNVLTLTLRRTTRGSPCTGSVLPLELYNHTTTIKCRVGQ